MSYASKALNDRRFDQQRKRAGLYIPNRSAGKPFFSLRRFTRVGSVGRAAVNLFVVYLGLPDLAHQLTLS